MKKVIVAMMLMAMTATTVAGCGSNDTAADTTTETAAEDTTADMNVMPGEMEVSANIKIVFSMGE